MARYRFIREPRPSEEPTFHAGDVVDLSADSAHHWVVRGAVEPADAAPAAVLEKSDQSVVDAWAADLGLDLMDKQGVEDYAQVQGVTIDRRKSVENLISDLYVALHA